MSISGPGHSDRRPPLLWRLKRPFHWSYPPGWGWEGPDDWGRAMTERGAQRALDRAEQNSRSESLDRQRHAAERNVLRAHGFDEEFLP